MNEQTAILESLLKMSNNGRTRMETHTCAALMQGNGKKSGISLAWQAACTVLHYSFTSLLHSVPVLAQFISLENMHLVLYKCRLCQHWSLQRIWSNNSFSWPSLRTSATYTPHYDNYISHQHVWENSWIICMGLSFAELVTLRNCCHVCIKHVACKVNLTSAGWKSTKQDK